MISMKVCIGSRTVEGTSITTVIGENESISSLLAELPITRKGSGTPSASNIRPFVLWDEIILYDANDEIIYHGTFDAVPQGEARIDSSRVISNYGYIASYDGEDLPSEWYSDRDADGSVSPTLGAEVVYALDGNVGRNIDATVPLPSYAEGDVFSAHGEVNGSVFVDGYAEGSIATIPPAETVTEGDVTYTPIERDAKSVVIGIEPIQALNGYDKPWSGGGGVNILDPSVKTTYSGANGLRWYEADGITLKANQAYTFKYYPESGEVVALYFRAKSDGTVLKSGNSPLTYTPTEDTAVYLQAYRTDISTDDKRYLLTEGTAAPTSWTPYSNICPISGWTGAEVTSRVGKNLVNVNDYIDTPASTIRANESSKFDGIKYLEITQYTASAIVSSTATNRSFGVWFKYTDGTTDYKWLLQNGATFTSATSASGKTIKQVAFAYDSAFNLNMSNFQFEVGATATAYEPFNGNTYNISWQTEAGTVYGGRRNITTGEMMVDRISKVFTSSAGFGSGCGYLDFGVNIRKTSAYPLISNELEYSATGFSSLEDNRITNNGGSATYAFAKVEGATDKASFDAWLADNPLQVVAYLATPQTYQLTPTEIALLQGQNNVWADCGDTEVTYNTLFYVDAVPNLEAEIDTFKEYEGTMCGKRHIPNFPTDPLRKPLLKAVVNGENALMTTDCVEVAPCGAVAVVCEATVCNTVVACDNE